MSSAAIIAATAAAVGTGYSIMQGEEQKRKQESASQQARDAALKNEKDADQAFNAANQKRPDVFGILARQKQATSAPTNLTGRAGSDPAALLGQSQTFGA